MVAVFLAQEGLAVELDDEGLAEEVEVAEEVEKGRLGVEGVRLAVELDGGVQEGRS